MERCETCRFWERTRYGGTQGAHCCGSHSKCRRHSPQPNPAAKDRFMGDAHWPITRKEDWCGEYQPHPGGDND